MRDLDPPDPNEELWRRAFKLAHAGNVALMTAVLSSERPLSSPATEWLSHFLQETRFRDLHGRDSHPPYFAPTSASQSDRRNLATFLFNVLPSQRGQGRPKRAPWEDKRLRNAPIHAALKEYKALAPDCDHKRDLVAALAEKHRGKTPLPEFMRKMMNRLGMTRPSKSACSETTS